MRAPNGGTTLRAQFVLLVVAGAVLPLAIVALWLTSSGVRAGERLLRQQLTQSIEQLAATIAGRWEYRRGDMLLFAENEVSVRVLASNTVQAMDRAYLDRLSEVVRHGIRSAELADQSGRTVWSLDSISTRPGSSDAPAGAPQRGVTFPVQYPVRGPVNEELGVFRARVRLASVIPADSARPIVPGARLGVRLVNTEAVLADLHTDLPFPAVDRYRIANEEWLALRRTISDPGLEIVLAAPLGPYTDAAREGGRVGLLALVAVTAAVLLLTGWLATRITRPLQHLADAADAVSRGELTRRVEATGPVEVQRAGRAFNLMTENLRATLDQLSEQSALAAVGGFARALSHDVRNALTSIKVDIERARHRPLTAAQSSDVLRRAANNVSRLESLMTGALRVARHGPLTLVELDVRDPIRGAAEVVGGAFAGVPSTLSLELPDEPLLVQGDAGALEQLFANILFNAAQALPPNGQARVRAARLGEGVEVEVSDAGPGMSETEIARLQQPFYSSKPNGTGLGLPIARQIAATHGAALAIASAPGEGTRVTLRFGVREPPASSHTG
jgi:signal transduction histidine kinase